MNEVRVHEYFEFMMCCTERIERRFYVTECSEIVVEL